MWRHFAKDLIDGAAAVFTLNYRRAIAAYMGLVSFLDGNVGKIVRALADSGLAESTRVVYSSDHGTMLGSQGHHNKQQPWDESINVPLVMRFGEWLKRTAPQA